MADYISVQEAFKTAAQYGKDYTDKKVNPLAEEIAVVSRAVDEKIAPIAREVDSLGDVVAKNTADITEQKDAVDKINDELVDIKYDVSAQTTRIGELYQEVEKATDKVDRMATDVGVLKSNKADKTYVDAEVKKVDDKYKAEVRRVDGKIDSTKAEVDTELGAIKEDIEQVEDVVGIDKGVTINIDAFPNKYIQQNGIEATFSGWNASDYVDLTGYSKIVFEYPQGFNDPYNCFYDENKAFLESFTIGNGDVEIPTNAKYVRISYNKKSYTISAKLVGVSDDSLISRIGVAEKTITILYDEVGVANTEAINVDFKKGVYIKADGEEASFYGWNASDFVDLTGYSRIIYTYSGGKDANNCFYDEKKQFVSSFTIDGGEKDVSIPSNARYARISYNAMNYTLSASLSTDYPVGSINDKIEKLSKSVLPFSGYKITTLGDSLVANGGWQNYLKSLGATFVNDGCGGTTLTYRDSQYYFYDDGRYAGETPKEGATLINDTISGYDRLSRVPSDTNILLVEFGTNDLHQSKPLGAWSDTDNTTFRGAMKYLASYMRNRLPECKIIFMTPTVERTDFVNTLGLHKIDYVKAILEAQVEINIPVINLWALTSWGSENYATYSADSIHWNSLGQKKVGEIVCGYLVSEKPITLNQADEVDYERIEIGCNQEKKRNIRM